MWWPEPTGKLLWWWVVVVWAQSLDRFEDLENVDLVNNATDLDVAVPDPVDSLSLLPPISGLHPAATVQTRWDTRVTEWLCYCDNVTMWLSQVQTPPLQTSPSGRLENWTSREVSPSPVWTPWSPSRRTSLRSEWERGCERVFDSEGGLWLIIRYYQESRVWGARGSLLFPVPLSEYCDKPGCDGCDEKHLREKKYSNSALFWVDYSV